MHPDGTSPPGQRPEISLRRRQRNQLVIILLFISAGIALSVYLFSIARAWEDKHIGHDFSSHGRNIVNAIEDAIAGSIHDIKAVKGLYDASYSVERSEFREFAEHLLQDNPSIQALEWVPRIPRSKRDDFETAARMEGFSDFVFTERKQQGKMAKAGLRNEYFPVYFVEPYKGNEKALGFDLASDKTRLEALEKARDTGEITSTKRITLVQETGEQHGFLLFQPVFARGKPLNTVEYRRRYLQGFALGVYRIGDMINKSLKFNIPAGINVYIYDDTAPLSEAFLYSSASPHASTQHDKIDTLRREIHFESMIRVADRKWLVICTAPENFLASQRTFQPWAILGGGFLLTVLLAGYLLLIQRRSADAERHTQELLKSGTRLQESEERFRAIFDNAMDGILVADAETRQFFTGNRAISRMLGYTPEEIKGIGVNDIHPPKDLPYVTEQFLRQSRGEFTLAKDIPVKRKDGSVFYADINSSPVSIGGRRYLIGMFRDATEIRKLEEQLRHAQKMEAIGKLAGGVAHDFNNILSAIMGYASLLQLKMDRDDPMRLNVDQILAASERAAQVTHSLLAFSRKQLLQPRPVGVNRIIRDTADLLSRLIGEDIDFRTELSEDDITVMADPGQIGQVLLNIATNARDAMPQGGRLTIGTSAFEIDDDFIGTHGYGRKGIFAQITIADTGYGMDNETKERIFDPFFTTKEVGKGSGLGLSIVYGIVKQHNGFVDVYSGPGQGAVFKIYLPSAETQDKIAEKIMEQKGTPDMPGGNETLLLAEDDDALRKLSRSVLSGSGYNVIEACNGDDAFEKFMENSDSVQMLILDVIMPGKDGRQVYEQIRAKKPDIKVIFISGYAPDIIVKRGIIDRDLPFILKPVLPKELLRRVREVLDS